MPSLIRRTVAALPGPTAGRSDVVHWDDALPGFGLRVFATGGRRWVVRYRLGRRQRLVTLGSVEKLDLTKAREKAREILAAAALGHDERAAIETRKAEAAAEPEFTFKALAEHYLERHAEKRQRPRTLEETRRALIKHAVPLHRKPVEAITRRHIAELLSDLAEKSGPIAANRARANLSAMWTWAMRQGLTEAHPVTATAKAAPERARERVLADDELRAIWQATDDGGDHSSIVRLLLLSGQRREEVGAMAWAELDLEAAVWTIPGARAKNNRAHRVPLSGPALAILEAIPDRGRSLVFGWSRKAPTGFSGWSRGKAMLDTRVAKARGEALAPWRLHDLRRTAVTGMAELGVAPHVVEAVVNHVSGHKSGVAGIYNRATYETERRAALELWSQQLLALVEDEAATVIPFRKA